VRSYRVNGWNEDYDRHNNICYSCPECGYEEGTGHAQSCQRRVAALKPLFIALKSEHFISFESGGKKFEIRKYGKRWNEKTCPVGRKVILSKGYGKKHRMNGNITSFSKLSANALSERDRVVVTLIYGSLDFYVSMIGISVDSKSVVAAA